MCTKYGRLSPFKLSTNSIAQIYPGVRKISSFNWKQVSCVFLFCKYFIGAVLIDNIILLIIFNNLYCVVLDLV